MREKVYFKNLRGEKLCGILEGPAQADKAVLLISGYASGKEEWDDWMVRYARALNNASFLTLRFDRAGIGESGGDFVDATWESELDDCVAAYKFLKAKCSNIAASGHSMGGALVVVLASKVEFKAVISSAPATEISKGIHVLYTKDQLKELNETGRIKMPDGWQSFGIKYMGKKYWDFAINFDILKRAKLVRAPTLVVLGTKDKYIPVDAINPLVNALTCKKKVEIIEGASHGFSPFESKFHEIAIAWFKKHL